MLGSGVRRIERHGGIMREAIVALVVASVLIGALALLLWHEREVDALDAATERATGLQAGIHAGETATVRWPSWTPLPTRTPRVYPSWTALPTRTPRWTATATARPTFGTPTAIAPPVATPTLPQHDCEEPWPFTWGECQNIAAAARNHLWLGGRREPQVAPQYDPVLSIGLYALDLGAPLTDEYHLLPDDGVGRIRCRGFALGIVALRERADMDGTCRAWAVVSWGGELEAD